MKKLLLLILPIGLLASCNCKNKDTLNHRYSTQTFSVAGMVVITQITDHLENKVYLYELSDKKGLTLKNTFDVSKCGAQNIPFEEITKDAAPNN